MVLMPALSSAPNSPASVFQRSLTRKLPFGSVCEPYFWLISVNVVDSLKPSKSNGRNVRMSTVPAMPPVTMLASVDLYTSRPLTAVAGRSWNENSRPPELKISRPLSVVTALGRPRITTVVVSPWNPWATCTPVTRCSASATLLSGSLPMSSATTESTIMAESCLIACALRKLFCKGVTTTPESVCAFCGEASAWGAAPLAVAGFFAGGLAPGGLAPDGAVLCDASPAPCPVASAACARLNAARMVAASKVLRMPMRIMVAPPSQDVSISRSGDAPRLKRASRRYARMAPR
jgi:hypothetical protein